MNENQMDEANTYGERILIIKKTDESGCSAGTLTSIRLVMVTSLACCLTARLRFH